jgi:hypothetical protein
VAASILNRAGYGKPGFKIDSIADAAANNAYSQWLLTSQILADKPPSWIRQRPREPWPADPGKPRRGTARECPSAAEPDCLRRRSSQAVLSGYIKELHCVGRLYRRAGRKPGEEAEWAD